MFSFRGRLGSTDYAIALGIRMAVLVGFIAAFPQLLTLIVGASGCRGIGGACGALALVVAMYAKPFIYYVFIFSLLGITIRRLHDAGLSVWLTVVPVILLLMDTAFVTIIGSPWSVAFVLGAMPHLPIYLLTGLATLTAFALLDSASLGSRPAPFWITGTVALTMAVGLIAGTLVLPTLLPAPKQLANAKHRTPAPSRVAGKSVEDVKRQQDSMFAMMIGIYWSLALKPYMTMAAGAYATSLAALVVIDFVGTSGGSSTGPGGMEPRPAPNPGTPASPPPRLPVGRSQKKPGFGHRSRR